MIAISYRREDSTSIAGRLHDRLRAEFGKENVFMDFDSIPYGVDFRDHITQTLEGADILIAVIGPAWLGQRAAESTRRIDDPSDFVRLEVAGALQRGIPVIPILVDKTSMPMQETLPDDLKPLVFRNALMLDTGIDFHHHADRLITGIRSLLKNRGSSSRRADSVRSKWFGVFDRMRFPVPTERRDQEGGVKSTSPTFTAEPLTISPEGIASQPAAPKVEASGTTRSESSGLIETDRDFERYGGGAKKSAPLAGSGPELTPVVSASRVSVQESSIVPPARPVNVARPGGDLREWQKSFFSAKLLGLVLAGVLIGLVTYFAVTWKTKSTSSQMQAAAPSAPASAQPSDLAGPDVASSASIAAQPSVQPLSSATPPQVSSPSPAGSADERQTGDVVVTAAMTTGPTAQPETSFTVDTPKLFVMFKTTGIKQGDKLRAVLVAEDVGDVLPLNSKLFATTSALEKDSSNGYFYFTSPTKGWSVGKYRVEIYVNDALATTTKFTIQVLAAASVSPVLSATPIADQTASGKNGRTWQAWIGDFVRQFVAANQSKDTNATLALYSPTVDYFDDHHADQAYIRSDIEKYNERWPVRHDGIEGDIHLQEKAPDQQYLANFKLNFYAESIPRNIWTKGQFTIDLDITIVDGVPKISGIKEKMVHQQKGKPGSTPSNNAARKSYASGIPVPGKPGFVRSPYAPSKGEIDVRRYSKGTQLKCPFSGKIFVAP